MQLDFLGDLKRTHRCGELRASDAGSTTTLMGWVNRRRDHGNLIFIDLRDRSGITQIVFDKERNPEMHERVESVRNEYVLAVTGLVKARSESTCNPKMETGEIEVIATELKLLNESKVPPFFPGDANVNVNEEVRLKYRYLDLRRPEMHANVEMRHRITLAIRNYLSSQSFYEIETPYMTRSTPEGARDYLVPSRVHPGEFYALPQSPQIFKQLLMIGGLDRYFQIARCFRDEDLRADRQPEFTQIDLELSFPTEETIHAVVEGFLDAAFTAAGYSIELPFPQMPYDEAIRLYGIDKPDLRLPAMTDVKALLPADAVETLLIDPSLPVVVIRTPNVGELSRKERDEHKALLSDRQSRVIKFFDDFKRLEKSWPEAIAKIRQLSQRRRRRPARDGGCSQKGRSRGKLSRCSRRTPPSARHLRRLLRRRTAPACAGAALCRAPQGLRGKDLQVSLGHRFPFLRVGRADRELDLCPSPVHLSA